MKLVPLGWRSSSFWNIKGEAMVEEGVEEHRKDEDSLLLKESMVMLGCTAIVRLLSPVTLSLEVHCDEVSELSVAVRGQGQGSLKGLSEYTVNCNWRTETPLVLCSCTSAPCWATFRVPV